MIILDSDVLITIFEKKIHMGDRVKEYLKEFNEEKVTTSLNLEEVLFGVLKRTGEKVLKSSHPLMNFPILSFTREDAIIASSIEFEMERIGKKKPRGDVLIAAITLRVKGKLFTLNKRHFQDIHNLVLLEFPE